MRYRLLLVALITLVAWSGSAQAQSNGDNDSEIGNGTGDTCSPGEGRREMTCPTIGNIGQVTGAGDAQTRRGIMQRVLDRLREEDDAPGGASADLGNGFGLFANGAIILQRQNQTARENKSDTNRYGTTIGADYRTGPVVAGLAFDYFRSRTNFEDPSLAAPAGRVGRRTANEFGLQGFGLYHPVPEAYLAALARVGYNRIRTRRSTPGGDTHGSASGHTLGLVGSAGYDIDIDHGLVLGLAASLDYERTRTGAYTESELPGAPGSRLRFDRDRATTLTSILELRLSRAFSTATGVLVPHVAGRYLHEFKDDSRTMRFATVSNGTVTSRGAFETNRPDRDYANLEVGLSAVFAEGWSAFATYNALLGHSYRRQHDVNFGLRRQF